MKDKHHEPDSGTTQPKTEVDVLGIRKPGDSAIAFRDSDSFNAVNRNNLQNQKDLKSRDNLMPNPDDFDEGDDQDSEGKGQRTPGL